MRNLTNPKKIKGQDKLNRIKDLMGKMNTINESDSTSEVELIKKGANGVVYGIVRENRDYFIKTSEKTSGEFIAEDFNYVGGLQNKSSEKYKSYATTHCSNIECIICFEYITSDDHYYFCKSCFIPAHKKCCEEWWFNQYKKHGRCVHCQTKNSLVLLKPCVKRSKLYNFVMYCLKKIGCYT